MFMRAGTSRGEQQLASVDRAHKKRHHGEPELKTALKLLVHAYREQAISILRATKASPILNSPDSVVADFTPARPHD